MNIYEYQAKVDELEATTLAINSESFILESLQLIVESHSDIAKPEFLFMRGYTPGFNDGEPCTHSSYIMDYDEFAEEYEGDSEGVCQHLDIEYDEGGSWLARSSSSTAYQVNYINDQSQVIDHKNDIAQKFKTIKQVFNLSIVEQAKLFDVSRQSIYKWIKGEAHIKPHNLALLNELEKAALLLLKENYSSVLFTEKVILNGLTITELVKEIQDGEKAVSLLVDILNREEKEKNLLKSLLDF